MTDTTLSREVLKYVGQAQPLVERLTETLGNYERKVAEVVPVFVEQGLVQEQNATKLLEKLASDPAIALEYLVKLAHIVGSMDQSMGSVVEKQSSVEDMDAFERWIHLGDPNAQA